MNNTTVIAITLWAGSTTSSQQRLEKLIVNQGGKMIDSRSVWLLRPNNENEQKQFNVQVALLNVRTWATSMVQQIQNVR